MHDFTYLLTSSTALSLSLDTACSSCAYENCTQMDQNQSSVEDRSTENNHGYNKDSMYLITEKSSGEIQPSPITTPVNLLTISKKNYAGVAS